MAQPLIAATLDGAFAQAGHLLGIDAAAARKNIDVRRLDTSEGPIDFIRGLVEAVKYAPAQGPVTAVIIDGIDEVALSPGSLAALTKILEEPPTHVRIILVTDWRVVLPRQLRQFFGELPAPTATGTAEP